MAIRFERISVDEYYDNLVLHLDKDDYYPLFEKEIKKIALNANLPGFRVGKTPISHIKNLYGKSVFYEKLIELINQQLNTYLEDNEYLFFPIIKELNIDPSLYTQPTPLKVEFHYFLCPKIEFDFSQFSPIVYEIDLLEADVSNFYNQELKNYSTNKNKATIDNHQDLISLTIKNKADSITNQPEEPSSEITDKNNNSADFNFDIELEYEKIPDTLKLEFNKPISEITFSTTLEKLLGSDWKLYLPKELSAKSSLHKDTEINCRVTNVSYFEPPELNSDLFSKICGVDKINTLEECHSEIKKTLIKKFNEEALIFTISKLYKSITNTYSVNYPEQYIEIYHTANNKDYHTKTTEEKQKLTQTLSQSLKNEIIISNLKKLFNIVVSEENVVEKIKADIENKFGYHLKNKADLIDNIISYQLKNKQYVNSTAQLLLWEMCSKEALKKTSSTTQKITIKELKTLLDDFNKQNKEEYEQEG